MNNAQLAAAITATLAAIAAAQDAETAILLGAIESYTIDTGQSRTVVNKLNIASLGKYLDILYNRCAMLNARLNGSNVTIGRPAF